MVNLCTRPFTSVDEKAQQAKWKWFVGPVVLVVLGLSGCIVVKESPAPGCRRVIGLAPMGGCFGKSLITGPEITPPVNCLTITANNCNGGVLVVHNQCPDSLTLDGVEIASGERTTLDVVQEDGEHRLVRASGNFSQYVPTEDEFVKISGQLGTIIVQLSFTKTQALCN